MRGTLVETGVAYSRARVQKFGKTYIFRGPLVVGGVF